MVSGGGVRRVCGWNDGVQLACEFAEADAAFQNNPVGAFGKFGVFLWAHVARGEHDDGNAVATFACAQMLEEFEAVHDGHHQIEEDEGGHPLGHAVEGFLTVGSLEDVPAFAREHGFHHAARVAVVVDEQHGAAACVYLEARGGAAQLGPVYRLDEIVGRAEREAEALFVHHGRHDDGRVGKLRVRAYGVKDGPAIHMRHFDVQQDGARFQRAGELQAGLAVGGAADIETFAGEDACHEVARGGIIVHHDDDVPACFELVCDGRFGSFTVVLGACREICREGDGEDGAFAWRAGDGDVAA